MINQRLLRFACIAAAMASALAIGGCGSEPRMMDANRYADDGYMGLNSSNPNFRMNPTHHTYAKDRQLMRQALREIGLDKRSTIVMSGPEVTVTFHLGKLEPGEEDAIRSDAYLLLKGQVPRYDYHIRFD